MGKTIVITSGKGGVGKSTTVANLGTGLAYRGKKVVLVDADIGLRNLDGVLGLENRIIRTIVDVIKSDYNFDRALVRDKKLENLFLLPASQTHDKDIISPEEMQELCQKLTEEFDYVLVDCPAGIEQGFKNAVAGAEEVIVVTNPEFSAMRDADRVIGLLNDYGKHNISLIVNKIRPKMVSQKQMLTTEDIVEELKIKLLGEIPDDEAIIISTNKGESILWNETSPAALAYKEIVARMEGQEVISKPLVYEETFFDKVKRILGFA